MTLKDLIHKHKRLQGSDGDSSTSTASTKNPSGTSSHTRYKSDPIPEFTFLRTTTNTQEVIEPPLYPGDEDFGHQRQKETPQTPSSEKKHRSLFRHRSGTVPSRSSSVDRRNGKSEGIKSSSSAIRTSSDTDEKGSIDSSGSGGALGASQQRPEMKRKLSDRLHLSSRARAVSRAVEASPNLPENLGDAPEMLPAPIEPPDGKGRVKPGEDKATRKMREELWERRACRLAMALPVHSTGPWGIANNNESSMRGGKNNTGPHMDEKQEINIQEAIRLHEEGNLQRSSAIFGRLADPKGANNPLSQILYGLALRHGWGIPPSHTDAITYLSLAARTSAQLELLASPGAGEAKGELILAIFELANCFRYGWGCKVDKGAARVFYEVAANLGDPDAMEEAAWCFMEGFGCVKDKVSLFTFHIVSVSCRSPCPAISGEAWRDKDDWMAPSLGHNCGHYVCYGVPDFNQSRYKPSRLRRIRFPSSPCIELEASCCAR